MNTQHPRSTPTSSLARVLTVIGLAIAVFVVAMAGSATAAKLITGKDIKNGSVTGKDLKKSTVNRSRLSNDVKAALDAPSVAGYEVKSTTVSVGTASADTAFVACSTGKVAVGGGGSFADTEFDATIQESSPRKVIGDFFAAPDGDFADGWAVTGKHNGLDPVDLTAWVICVDPT